MKKDGKEYKPPTTSFAVTTTNKLAYKPIESKEAYNTARLRPMTKTDRRPAKFDDQTMNKRFYQDWGIQPRLRYGDLHEANIYVAPVGEMASHSETMAAYDGKKLDEPTKPFLPASKQSGDPGQHDFRTVHKETYQGLRKPLCKAQAYLLQQELLRRKGLTAGGGTKQPVPAAT